MERTIKLSHYDYDKKETISDGEVGVRDVAKAITAEQLGEIICDFVNSYSNATKSGTEVGKAIAGNHRTLQGCAVNLMVNALCEIANTGTDARNQVAVQTCQFIREALRSDKIHIQPFI